MQLLSSTHFGMATPQLHQDRLAKGLKICTQLQELQAEFATAGGRAPYTELVPKFFEKLQLEGERLRWGASESVQVLQASQHSSRFENGILFFDVQQAYDRSAHLQAREIKPLEITWERLLPPGGAFKVIKKNFHGTLSEFYLDYWKRSPANEDLLATNNAITNQWVAVSDGVQTLILFFDPRYAVNMAAVPMRLQRQSGKSVLSLNPYGVYDGKQPLKSDYWSAVFDLGRWLTLLKGEQFKSGAPSFVGGEHRFRLGLAVVKGGHVDKPVDEFLSKLYDSFEAQTDFLNFPIKLPKQCKNPNAGC
jgi:hypothetical protein